MKVPSYLKSSVEWHPPPFLRQRLAFFYRMRLYDSLGNFIWINFYMN